ncbi:hypothetical protein OG203_00905 [Nocardia sp. NBC_01499]|uniref:hypothetical protein n=1 Tax=Nocardia sp. NBC_01499 TaxID=2903597 RepID=UPI00386ADE5D
MIGAITMPVHLGLRIRACMLRRNLPLGPIIAHPRSQRWTFLVRPDISDADVKLYAEMFRSYVTVVRAGGEIALPSPADTKAGFRDWIVPPRDSFRPSGAAIIDLVRECTRATLR